MCVPSGFWCVSHMHGYDRCGNAKAKPTSALSFQPPWRIQNLPTKLLPPSPPCFLCLPKHGQQQFVFIFATESNVNAKKFIINCVDWWVSTLNKPATMMSCWLMHWICVSINSTSPTENEIISQSKNLGLQCRLEHHEQIAPNDPWESMHNACADFSLAWNTQT